MIALLESFAWVGAGGRGGGEVLAYHQDDVAVESASASESESSTD